MTSTNRLLSFLFLGAIATAISACASPAVQECGATGVYCPAGTHCAAAQGICISDTNTCGNAHLDPGEICDDGNTQPGDGCAPDCMSDETCGNGTLDQPIKDSAGVLNRKDPRNEDCDTPLAVDPNTGKFCSAVCKFEVCGNSIIDKEVSEQCDDGNTAGGDGCSADCLWVERCGNGHLDQPFKDSNGNPDLKDARNEVCDDGNNRDGDGCSSDCRSAEGCGNGNLDPGEECDNGKELDGTPKNGNDKDCRSDCVINRCGDGRPNTQGVQHEDCDGGPLAPDHDRTAKPTETPACNIDCTTPTCGDGKINRSLVLPNPPGSPPGLILTEQCDNGMANSDSADCTANCQVSVCGDNLPNTIGPLHREGCDDGNRIDTDLCTNACVAKSCGDSIVGPSEECDLGLLNSDSGACLSNCLLARCGDGKVRTGVEECDMTLGCSAACKIQQCGNGIIDPGEDCDNGLANNNDNADCRSDCVTNRCGDGHINSTGTHHEDCDAGPVAAAHSTNAVPTEAATCNIDCTTPVCGDRKVNRSFKPPGAVGPEQCDNGTGVNANNADCTATCQTSVCGDGLPNTVGPAHAEGCDDGNRTDTDACTNACAAKTCGDGIVGTGEECDLGLLNSDTGACLSNCLLAKCGDGKVRAGVEECDLTAGLQPCSTTCRQQKCGNGIIDPTEECDNGSANNDNGDCRSDCILNRCGDGHTNSLGLHKENCDGGPVAAANDHTVTPTETATCNVNCTTARCGDSVINHKFVTVVGPPALLEQCDPPSVTNLCSATCQFEHCGNGILDPGEQCDGPGVGLQPCSSTCFQQKCGNGIVDPSEECDNGSANNDNADCRSDCVTNRCGDGFTNNTVRNGNAVEECDGGPRPTTAGDRTAVPTNKINCNSNCKSPSCGDSFVNPLFVAQTVPPAVPANTLSEQCDPPGPGCSAICRLENCGNGVKDPGEQCDDGDGNNGNGCENDCTLPRCGNGITDVGEACDDGNLTNGDTCDTNCTVPACQNGVVDPGEQCDDHNAADGDGCDSNCKITACGNGIPTSGEVCDDGNLLDTDGCTSSCKLAVCGDGIKRTTGTPAQIEGCDDGNTVTETCAYGVVSCTVCDSTCHSIAGATNVCGDGNLDPQREICDDGNATCGSCSADCTVLAAVQATGLIFAAAANDYKVAGGDTFTLSDGITTQLFEITTGTTTTAGVKILVTAGDSNAVVAGKIAVEINGKVLINATVVGSVVMLKHQRSTVNGNVAITETVATSNFATVGMDGGQGGNCPSVPILGACTQDVDCASNHCVGVVVGPPTIPGVCGP